MDLIKIFQNNDAIVGKGATDEQITKAESDLNLKFAEDYRKYISDFGAVMMNGHEFSGISKADRMDVVKLTQEEREFNDSFPSDMYVIENTGVDGIVICQNFEGNIYRIQEKSKKKIENSFVDYIEQVESQ